MPRSTSKKSTASKTNDTSIDAPVVDGNSTSGTLAAALKDDAESTFNLSNDPGWDEMYAQLKISGDPQLREQLILAHRKLVAYLARRFTDRGELLEDVLQHGLIGLIQALDNFDPNRGVRFSTFATPSIIGEIQRYFRDRSHGVRLPRRVQDLSRGIALQIDDLTQKLNHSPTYAEIALHLGVSEEDVIEAIEMGHAAEPMSLDEASSPGEDSPFVLADRLGQLDPDIENYQQHEELREALLRLPALQQQVLQYAYFEGYNQTEIAQRLNVSQMHISRLLRRSLSELKKILNEHK